MKKTLLALTIITTLALPTVHAGSFHVSIGIGGGYCEPSFYSYSSPYYHHYYTRPVVVYQTPGFYYDNCSPYRYRSSSSYKRGYVHGYRDGFRDGDYYKGHGTYRKYAPHRWYEDDSCR